MWKVNDGQKEARWCSGRIFEKFENPARMYINCEKSGGLYLAERSLTAGWLAGRQNLGEA